MHYYMETEQTIQKLTELMHSNYSLDDILLFPNLLELLKDPAYTPYLIQIFTPHIIHELLDQLQ